MAVITTGGGTGLTINATGNSANTKLVDSNGNELFRPPSTGNAYQANFSIVQTGTPAAASLLWHMRNLSGGSTNVRIRNIRFSMSFTGTAAATSFAIGFYRTGTATPTGGASVAASKKSNAMGSTVVTDIRFTIVGLTLGSLSKETDAFYIHQISRSVTNGVNSVVINYAMGEYYSPLILQNGEGLGIYNYTTSVAGDTITGGVEWDEST